MAYFRNIVEGVGAFIDAIGVLVIVIGIIVATVLFLMKKTSGVLDPYRYYRQNLGKAILLGLEILVAGDIIRTVGVAPTMANVLILAIIVMIRTFLSWSLDVELEGRWPWQRNNAAKS